MFLSVVRDSDCIVLLLPSRVIEVDSHGFCDRLAFDKIRRCENESFTVVLAAHRLVCRWLIPINIKIGHSSFSNTMISDHDGFESFSIGYDLRWQAGVDWRRFRILFSS